jgi:hypothetical protein
MVGSDQAKILGPLIGPSGIAERTPHFTAHVSYAMVAAQHEVRDMGLRIVHRRVILESAHVRRRNDGPS